jgi:hypothetical protein
MSQILTAYPYPYPYHIHIHIQIHIQIHISHPCPRLSVAELGSQFQVEKLVFFHLFASASFLVISEFCFVRVCPLRRSSLSSCPGVSLHLNYRFRLVLVPCLVLPLRLDVASSQLIPSSAFLRASYFLFISSFFFVSHFSPCPDSPFVFPAFSLPVRAPDSPVSRQFVQVVLLAPGWQLRID